MQETEEIVLKGLSLSEGIAIGVPFFFLPSSIRKISEVSLSPRSTKKEIVRYREALKRSRQELEILRKNCLQEGTAVAAEILETHLQILQDPVLNEKVEEKICLLRTGTVAAFQSVIEEYKMHFRTIATKDPFFGDRMQDVMDISQRVLSHLHYQEKDPFPASCIVVSEELAPSETAQVQSTEVSAFVTQTGGKDSHAALILRTKGIPCVSNIDLSFLKKAQGQKMIVNGCTGEVILYPKADTIKKHEKAKKHFENLYRKLRKKDSLPAKTQEGHEVHLFGNAETSSELDILLSHQGEGIALFRSEYWFIKEQKVLSEEEQFLLYREMAQKLQGKVLTIRLLDIGSDKKIDALDMGPCEENPALGCRGMRYLFSQPKLLKEQLRAILRASPFGKIEILLPFISSLSEVRTIKAFIEKIKRELLAEGKEIAPLIPLGCMVEVPSMALMADVVIKEIDFLSIGTNDLLQYTLAADRNHPRVQAFSSAAHPGFLRLLHFICKMTLRKKKRVCLCGEIAADKRFFPLLLGLGFRDFSLAPRQIPFLQEKVRNTRLVEARRLVKKALSCSTAEEVLYLVDPEKVGN